MNPDQLVTQAILDILSEDVALAAIPAYAAISEEEDDEKPETSLTVTATSSGRSIETLYDYEVEVMLRRQFRGTQDVAAFELLWQSVRAQIEDWYNVLVLTPLAILTDIDHFTVEEIDGSADIEIADQRISRSLTFTAFIKPA